MSKGNRIEKLRIPRNGTARHRSLAGGVVIGDYVDPVNGERVLTVERVAVVKAASASKKAKAKPPNAASFPPGVVDPPEVYRGA